MKNKDFDACWSTYTATLSDISKKRVKPIIDCIEQFESNGFDVSTMNYSESQILVSMLAKNRTYSTLVSYCALYNKFVKTMRTVLDREFQKLLPRSADNNAQLYTSEEQFLLDVEQRLAELTERFRQSRNATVQEMQNYRDGRLHIVVYMILLFYGFSKDECRFLKMTDIDENLRTIRVLRNNVEITRQLSEEAFEYVRRYMHLTSIIHYFNNPVIKELRSTGYLLRDSRHHKTESSEVVSATALASGVYQFTKGSSIKRWIALSGAFISYAEQSLDPEHVCEYINDFLGESVCSDMNIRRHWLDFLELLEKGETE